MKTLKMMTDEELVVLYAEGNNAAFDILLNRYKSSIHSYIYFIVQPVPLDKPSQTVSRNPSFASEANFSPPGHFSLFSPNHPCIA